MNPQLILVLVAAAVVLYVMVFAAMWASRYTKVGPNQALIISGRQRELPDGTRVGFRIVKGGGTFVWPAIEKVDVLSLEVLTVEMPKSNVRTAKGGSVEAECVAQVKIKSDDASISVAAEHLLSKEADELKNIVRPALERRLRATLAGLSLEEMSQNLDALADQVQASAADDLAKLGVGMVRFTIQDVRAA